MSLIEVENLSKQFRVARKPEGGRGRLRRLRRDFADVHAVDGVSFVLRDPAEMVGNDARDSSLGIVRVGECLDHAAMIVREAVEIEGRCDLILVTKEVINAPRTRP